MHLSKNNDKRFITAIICRKFCSFDVRIICEFTSLTKKIICHDFNYYRI